MKLFLEQETEKDGDKSISTIKEVLSKAQAIKDKTASKCYLHTCFHDENKGRPCKREAL